MAFRRAALSEHYEQLGFRTHKLDIADDRECSNVQVLAGTGFGQAWALVHRIAYTERVRARHLRLCD